MPSNVNSPTRASPSCRRRSTASTVRTSPAATMAREKYAAARKVAEDQNEPQAATKYDELRLRAIAAQREQHALDLCSSLVQSSTL